MLWKMGENEKDSIKDDRINFRISSSKKNNFEKVCKNILDSNASKTLEEYIDKVINENKTVLDYIKKKEQK